MGAAFLLQMVFHEEVEDGSVVHLKCFQDNVIDDVFR